MNKEEIIKILEDYEFFVDDDWGGHYEHINCSQRALTPLGIIQILDYITSLEQQCKKQKEVIDKLEKKIKVIKQYDFDKVGRYELLDILKRHQND